MKDAEYKTNLIKHLKEEKATQEAIVEELQGGERATTQQLEHIRSQFQRTLGCLDHIKAELSRLNGAGEEPAPEAVEQEKTDV